MDNLALSILLGESPSSNIGDDFQEWTKILSIRMGLYDLMGFGESFTPMSEFTIIEKYVQENKELLSRKRSRDSDYSSLDNALFSCINVRYSLEEAKSIITLFLKNGANINGRYYFNKQSLLHSLVSMSRCVKLDVKKLALFLIENGIDCDGLDDQGNTALDLATDPQLKELLKKHTKLVDSVWQGCEEDPSKYELTQEEIDYHNQRFDEHEEKEREINERESKENDQFIRENAKSLHPWGWNY